MSHTHCAVLCWKLEYHTSMIGFFVIDTASCMELRKYEFLYNYPFKFLQYRCFCQKTRYSSTRNIFSRAVRIFSRNIVVFATNNFRSYLIGHFIPFSENWSRCRQCHTINTHVVCFKCNVILSLNFSKPLCLLRWVEGLTVLEGIRIPHGFHPFLIFCFIHTKQLTQ